MQSKKTVDIRAATIIVSTKLRALGLGLLLALITTSSVQARPATSLDRKRVPKAVSTTFKLSPDSATIWRRTGEGQTHFLGQAGEKVTIGLNSLEASGKREIIVEYRVRLWFSEWTSAPEFLSLEKLRSSKFYPALSTQELDLSGKERFQAWTRAHPLACLVFVVSLLGLPLLVFRLKKMKASAPGQRSLIPNYKVFNKLGQGGMGEVFRAADTDGIECAVKLLRPALSAGPEFQKQFDKELSISSKLNHSNLLKVFAYGVARDGRAYMVTELLKGKTLKEELQEPTFAPQTLATAILEEVGAALTYLHSQGLAHQDVKPSNIFLSEDGSVKLLDLGVARSLDDEESKAHGTPRYMAPEQFAGETSPASDQYSLGLVLFEILTKIRPYGDLDGAALAHKKSLGPPEFPPELAQNYPEFAPALAKMMESEPGDRFGDLGEISEVLGG